MTRSIALAAAAAAAPLSLVALLLPGRIADWVFALASVIVPVALMALGAAGRRRSPGAAWALAALLAVLAGSAAGVLALSGAAAGRELAGFPAAAVIQIAGLWLLPLPIATLAYALTFDRTGLTRRDLEMLRARTGRPLAPSGGGTASG